MAEDSAWLPRLRYKIFWLPPCSLWGKPAAMPRHSSRPMERCMKWGGFLAIPSERLTSHPHQQWAFLEADAPAPDNPSSDCSLSQRLDCNFIRGSEPQAPSWVASRLLTHTSSGIIHVCYFKQSHFGVIYYVAIHSKYNIQTRNPRNRKGERQWTFLLNFFPFSYFLSA